jgi:hypothetical protein
MTIYRMYTLADFARIEKTYRGVLPSVVKQRIQTMCKSVGAQPVFSVMVQNKSTLQDAIREINKLTDTNRAIQTPLILEIVSQIDVMSFAEVFFTIVGKNPFCSKTYATLFVQLQTNWEVFTNIFESKYTEYLDSFDRIVAVEQDDYDLFCEWKASNDQRRTFTLFLIHITELHAVPITFYDRSVKLILERIEKLLDHQDKDVMNELVENLFLLKPKNEEYKKTIEKWTTMKPTDHVGLSYKIIFRLMDVLK